MRTVFFRVLLIGLISLLGLGCVSKNLNEGSRSFRMQNYRDAFIRLKPEAKRGQPDAQYAIGYMYYYGQGVVEDRKRAWYWISKAARSGQPDAVAALEILEKVA